MDTPEHNEQTEKIRAEMSMLHEISNAVFSTLKSEEIFYIVLTCITAKQGLAFDRAMLFLIEKKQKALIGKMGIGPKAGARGRRIWRRHTQKEKKLNDFILANQYMQQQQKQQLNNTIRSLKIPLAHTDEIVSMTFLEGMPFNVDTERQHSRVNPELKDKLDLKDFVCVPLKGKRRTLGVILADNFITQKTITQEDIKMLIMFISQAGLAVENSQLYEEVLRLSNTDSLTGLWNHGHFQYILSRELNKANRKKQPLSLLMLDIDNFKNYNDTLGHPAGDKLLVKLARLLKNQARKEDIVTRYGGEEFSIILPGVDEAEATEMAERLRQTIETYKFAREHVQLHGKVTMSIGVCTYQNKAIKKKDLIYRADMALYQAKRHGKNRVWTYKD